MGSVWPSLCNDNSAGQPDRDPEDEQKGGDSRQQGPAGRGPGDEHAEAEEAQHGPAEHAEYAQPGLDEAGYVLDQEGEKVAEDAVS